MIHGISQVAAAGPGVQACMQVVDNCLKGSLLFRKDSKPLRMARGLPFDL